MSNVSINPTPCTVGGFPSRLLAGAGYFGVAAALRATATAELSYRFSALYWHSDQRK